MWHVDGAGRVLSGRLDNCCKQIPVPVCPWNHHQTISHPMTSRCQSCCRSVYHHRRHYNESKRIYDSSTPTPHAPLSTRQTPHAPISTRRLLSRRGRDNVNNRNTHTNAHAVRWLHPRRAHRMHASSSVCHVSVHLPDGCDKQLMRQRLTLLFFFLFFFLLPAFPAIA